MRHRTYRWFLGLAIEVSAAVRHLAGLPGIKLRWHHGPQITFNGRTHRHLYRLKLVHFRVRRKPLDTPADLCHTAEADKERNHH